GYIQVMKDGENVMLMHPEKRIYNVQTMPMTEAAIDSGFTRDLYVSLGEPVSGGAWSVRIYHKPFVNWIWGGCALMALGGLFAICDRRYRIASRQRKEAEKRKMATANKGSSRDATGTAAVAREAKV
ncbi:MAG TPA: c-type cytochrome biogenesis protein CcmF, partial [Chromatiales bacterium]|nr:c-type cytochrome biogenesis protein CcmF [Chromatiales bacterium]